MSDCCKKGFNWTGTPEGTETTLGETKTYVTGTSKSAAILFIHDIFGWSFTNARLVADHFAKEADATVYVPDFFDGEIISPETLDSPEKQAAFDFPAFLGRHGKHVRWETIKAAAKALKAEFPKVGAIGYCYGGWATFQLGADPSLIDAISTAHPSLLEKSEVDAVKVPVQILSPEHDPMFTDELKEYVNKVIPTLGVPYEYVYFPGLVHGFATRGNPESKSDKDGLERAKNNAVNFFNQFLH